MPGTAPSPQARIARIVHRLAPAGGPVPDQHERHWQAWQRQLPGWEFRTWTAADLATLPDAALLARAEGAGRQSHIACYAILHACGGVWLDGDMMPYFPFAPDWMDEELLVCSELDGGGYCSMGFIAAAPRARVLGWALETLRDARLNVNPPNLETGPFLLARALAHGPHRMLAPQVFHPYQKDELVSSLYRRDLADSRGIRVWSAPKPAGQALLAHALRCVEQGDLRAAGETLGERDTWSGRPLRALVATARTQRTQLLEAAKEKLAGARVRIDDPVPLALLKVAFFVLGEIPDLLVWQLGAGDGITQDPLRPLLVNFDPHAVLLEPNPASFAQLQANYAANTHVRFVHAAFAAEAGPVVLRAPDPNRMAEHGLPPAVAGLATTAPERVRPSRAAFDSATNRAIEASMTAIEVAGLDVGALLELNPGIQPGIVVIDTGGSEFAFVDQMLAWGVQPFILQFPLDTLAPHEASILNDMLQRDYVLCAQGSTMLAYRSDVFTLYCEHLYVEHGMPTIYRDAFRLLLGF